MSAEQSLACRELALTTSLQAGAGTSTQPIYPRPPRLIVLPSGASSSSENSGVAELKGGGQVSCDTAHNQHLTCSYITPHARAAARPHAGASTSFAFS